MPTKTLVVQKGTVTGYGCTSEGGFPTIAAALAVATAGDTILVNPGTYIEQNPLTLPAASIALIATGGATNTTIAFANPGSDGIVVHNLNNFLMKGFSFAGATGGGKAGILLSGTSDHCVLQNVAPLSNDIGIHSAASGTNYVVTAGFWSGTLTSGIRASTGAKLEIHGISLGPSAVITRVIHAQGVGAEIAGDSILLMGALSTSLLYANDGGLLHLESTHAHHGTYAVHIGADGTASTVCVTGIDITEAVTYGLYIQSASAVVRLQGRGEVTKVSNPGGTPLRNIVMTGICEDVAGVGMLDTGFRSVGWFGMPSQFDAGEGREQNADMLVLRNTNGEIGAWSDITARMKDNSGSTEDLFVGTGIGNALFIGSTVQPYSALWANLTTALVFGAGSLTCSYWNGAIWVPIYQMATQGGTSRAQRIFTWTGEQHIRFTDYRALSALKTLNTTFTAHWLKWEITGALTTVPTCEQLKLHGNHTRVQSDGIREYFGNAQPTTPIILPPASALFGAGAPGNVNIAVSPSVTYVAEKRSFNTGDGIVFAFQVPDGVDTSKPWTLRSAVKPSTNSNGVAKLQVYVSEAVPGDLIAGARPQQGILLSPAMSGVQDAFQAVIEHQFYTPNAVPGEMAWVTFYRDAVGDTFAGNVQVMGQQGSATFWR